MLSYKEFKFSYSNVDKFGNWLGEKQTSLQQLRQSNLLPVEQFVEAKTICSDIFDNHTELETIKGQGQQLTAGLRSLETTAAKTKVSLDLLCSEGNIHILFLYLYEFACIELRGRSLFMEGVGSQFW